jgi:hypothetical protein
VASTRGPDGKASPHPSLRCGFHLYKVVGFEEADAKSTEQQGSRSGGSRGVRVIASGRILEDGTEVPDPEPVAAPGFMLARQADAM